MGRTVSRSWELHRAQRAHLAGGSSTNSKTPRFDDAEPALIVRGKGCRVWDVDGNEYVDFRFGLGPVSLGYAVPEIDAAITAQLADGEINTRHLLRLLKKSGYEGPICLEGPRAGDREWFARQDVSYVRKLLVELGM